MAEGPPRAGFGVWAAGLPNGYVVMERQATTIQVTTADLATGVVNVPDGSRIVIVTFSPGAYALDFSARAAMFRSVRIEGVGRAIELGRDGGTVVTRDVPSGRRVISFSYLFHLAPDAVPGTYVWPLQMAVRSAAPADFDVQGASPRLPPKFAPYSLEGRHTQE